MLKDDTALIVIDVQESFRHRDYWNPADVSAFSDRMQSLADGARQAGIPIVQIFHVEDSGVFSLASGHVRTLTPLAIEPDAVFHKRRHSALVGSGLPIWLTERGIRRAGLIMPRASPPDRRALLRPSRCARSGRRARARCAP